MSSSQDTEYQCFLDGRVRVEPLRLVWWGGFKQTSPFSSQPVCNCQAGVCFGQRSPEVPSLPEAPH